jgi:hypothetical protein
MKLVAFEGFLVPGLSFEDCCIWVLSWSDTPTPYKNMREVWVLRYDGRKTCYIDPGEAGMIFRKYHDFAEVVPANIAISSTDRGINIDVVAQGNRTVLLGLRFKTSLKYCIINLLMRCSNPERLGTKGKTETGMRFHNVPKRLVPVSIEKAEMNGKRLKHIGKPKTNLALGDGKPSDVPLIIHCRHLMQEYTL